MGPPVGYPPERPAVVTAAVAAMLLLMAFGLVNAAVVLSLQDDFSKAAALFDAAVLDYFALLAIFASLVPSLVYAVLAAFVLHGRQWARMTVWVISGVLMLCGSCGVLGSLFAFQGIGGWLQWYPVLYSVGVLLLLGAVIIFLALPASNSYFAAQTWLWKQRLLEGP